MKNKIHILVISFMIFSNFFGAGNLIFPPFLGATSGSEWMTSFLGFIIGDVGIVLLSFYAVVKAGSYQNIVGRAGKKFGLSLEIIMMLCLGPILVIPRTGATTFEMSIAPIFPEFNSVIFSIIFYALVFIISIKPSKVVDIIGKYLTPILLIALSILIIKGIVSPVGSLNSDIQGDKLFIDGITQGYQTMDALGAGGIAAFIMLAFKNKGYTDKKQIGKYTMIATTIACVGLVIVYGGLAYLGATVSTNYTTDISQTALLVNITSQLLGTTGTIILSIIVAFACFTTASTLTSVTANYFAELTKNKIKYNHVVIAICLFSLVMANLGVDKIISIAVPILTVLYPVAIILVLMSSLPKIFNDSIMFKGAAYITLIINIFNVIDTLGIKIEILNTLPLGSIGFNWFIPAILGAYILKLFGKRKDNNHNKIEKIVQA